jgi:DNA-binding NtrC family response regulator
LLAKHFGAKAARTLNAPEKPVSKEAMFALVNHEWRGNVRELENAIERAFILSGDEIDVESLPPKIRAGSSASVEIRDTENFRPTLEETERRYITEIMQATGEDKAQAANILGIDLSTLYRKLKRYEDG